MLEFLIILLWTGIEGQFWLVGGSKEKKVIKGCKPCYELKGIKDINNEKHFTQVIRAIRKQIVVCSFKETTLAVNNVSGAFLKLPITVPWPDYIEHSFLCNKCQAEYKLSAETLNIEENHSIQGHLTNLQNQLNKKKHG